MNSLSAKEYLTALKVVREIQRKQAYTCGRSSEFLAQTLQAIEMFCPLDFSNTCGRVTRKDLVSVYNGMLFK